MGVQDQKEGRGSESKEIDGDMEIIYDKKRKKKKEIAMVILPHHKPG